GIETRSEERHDVAPVPCCRPSSVLAAAHVAVNSSHHQAVAKAAPALRVAARSADGVVEAAESPQHPFLLGVQWHPERMDAPSTRSLFAAFVDAARKAAAARS